MGVCTFSLELNSLLLPVGQRKALQVNFSRKLSTCEERNLTALGDKKFGIITTTKHFSISAVTEENFPFEKKDESPAASMWNDRLDCYQF